MDKIVLEVKNINKAFGGVQALEQANLTIRAGEVHCLAGGNGSGKSTLIKVISGVHKPDAGSIMLNGTSYQYLTPIEAIEQGVQVIYQDLSVFPNLSVAENIAINNEVREKRKLVNWKKVHQIAREALERIDVKMPLNRCVEELSIADKQLIAIARAIFQDAKLMILDEPTTALTRREIDKLFAIIRRLQSEGIAVLFVSHKLDEVFEIADNFTILRNGKNVITDATAHIDHNKFVYYMSGREIQTDLFLPQDIDTSEPLFEVSHLGVKNGFSDVSFCVYAGEIIGITGQLGSGRTELAKSLFGIYPAQQGEIRIDGKPVVIRSTMDAVKNKIAYVPEDRLTEGLFLSQPIRENAAISHIDALVKENGNVDKKKIAEDMQYWKAELSIKMHEDSDAIATLSGGNQQKVVLAKWLEIQPRVLILNGPTVGVDVGAKYDLHQYLRGLARTKSIAIVIISDDISEVHQNCNRILIMRNGKLCGETRNVDITEQELSEQILAQI